MKTKFGNLAIAGWLVGTIIQSFAQGYIVPNGIYPGTSGFPGTEVSVVQNPDNADYTGFFLIPRSKTPPASPYTNTFSFDYYLDEGVRVFLVSANQPISLQPILANTYTELSYPNSYVFEHGSPFYVGLYTGPTMPQNGVYDDPLYGWARLINNQGSIQLLDSALAYKAGGIYAGTQNLIPVPEPSTVGLLAFGALFFGWWQRRSRH